MYVNNGIKMVMVFLTALLVGWSVFIPVFEGPDESGHYCHAEYIAKQRRLPNFLVQDGCFLAYPPGYYVLVAPIIALRPVANFDDEQIQPNPEYISNRKGKDVFAKYIHPLSELTFQWNPLLQTVHLIRLLSVAMGLGIIVLTIKATELTWSLRGAPTIKSWATWQSESKDEIATLPAVARNDLTNFRWLPYASVILFFNPMFLHTFSLVSNVTLVSFLAAVFIYLHLKQEVSGSSGKLALLQGVVMGLGVMTKINMLSLVLGYVVAILTSGQQLVLKIRNGVLIGLGFAVSAGWYIIRTFQLYGEPFEVNIAASFRGASMTRMQDMGVINYWSSFPDTLFRTFWSGYGLNKVWLPDVVIAGLLIMTLFIFVGFFSSYRKLPRLVKVSFYYAMAVLAGHVLINIKTEAFHAKDIFIAYLPLSLMLSFGARNFIVEAEKNGFLTSKRFLIIFGLSMMFYAKFEIVRLIKLALTGIGLTGGFAAESISLPSVLLHFTGKGAVILGLILIIRHLGNLFRNSCSVIARSLPARNASSIADAGGRRGNLKRKTDRHGHIRRGLAMTFETVSWRIGLGVLVIFNILVLGWTSYLLYSEFL